MRDCSCAPSSFIKLQQASGVTWRPLCALIFTIVDSQNKHHHKYLEIEMVQLSVVDREVGLGWSWVGWELISEMAV